MNANSNQIAQTGSLPMATPSVHKCWVCSVMSECAECAFCERETCERCQRQCEGCLESFCSLCSTTNYDEKYDRTFCLDCNEEVRRSSPNRKPVTGFSQLPTPLQQPYFKQLQYNFQ
ncbi:hypothetical protein SARC_12463 [Sphaeroforma arctica JP610]|uniref:Uncharacterized protein n=1 Tax=Sphaeroforma arctica JP610 TaxID=667725 RepID=A0A0L0FE18_9EUKA|nr:hypothetical protein SARC_12463 [Sphaeroforma arctica JP610]KNC75004.1 hypothetical protein SARC_12463 [Sphaeroforma arctica JP610]|eukprot:XP_014148906.1 hypothetical protein SARC_12463 [Sphaeroforma arctica JP610]